MEKLDPAIETAEVAFDRAWQTLVTVALNNNWGDAEYMIYDELQNAMTFTRFEGKLQLEVIRTLHDYNAECDISADLLRAMADFRDAVTVYRLAMAEVSTNGRST